MAYWLFKSEPDTWSWEDQVKAGARGTPWDGVRNYQARNNMRAMSVGDLGFFYHSVDEKRIVGIVKVISSIHPDPKDATGTWECVDIAAVELLPKPVSLDDVKASAKLADMALVKNARLSVQPVTAAEWKLIRKMGGFT